MRTTIKDIANYTGFSVTTISLVLNGKAHKIPKSTKEKIQKAVEELNYRPNQLAVGLVKKRTKTIGLVISDVSNVFFSNLAKGVEDECRRNGWNLILCNTNDIHKRDMEYIQVLADKGVDGILFCMSLDSDEKKAQESVKLMQKLKVPFVMVDRFIEGVGCCSVIVNHRSGGYAVTKHLLQLGHRRIGCVTGPLGLEDSRLRLKGYQEALEEYGVAFDEKLIYEGNYDRASGSDGTEYFLSMPKKVTAIFAFNDLSAYGAYHCLRKNKIAVPGDVSLVGYDDIFFSEVLDVPLTTVNQPVYDMGVEAVQQLIHDIDGEESSQRFITFQPRLVIRDSTAKCKEEGKEEK